MFIITLKLYVCTDTQLVVDPCEESKSNYFGSFVKSKVLEFSIQNSEPKSTAEFSDKNVYLLKIMQ